jgi:signal transduction histidine kinase
MSGSGVARPAGMHSIPPPLPREDVAFLWHDLRQSVAVIRASATAAADSSLSSEARRWLNHISDEASRISRICEHAVRPDSGPRALRSLDEVAMGVIDSIGVVSSTDIAYRRSGEDTKVDGAAVERALMNIVGNACTAAGPGGRVRIEIRRDTDGSVIIAVDDSGPGFPTTSDGNAGLGMDATRRVLASLGGSLLISKSGGLGGARAELRVPSRFASTDR